MPLAVAGFAAAFLAAGLAAGFAAAFLAAGLAAGFAAAFLAAGLAAGFATAFLAAGLAAATFLAAGFLVVVLFALLSAVAIFIPCKKLFDLNHALHCVQPLHSQAVSNSLMRLVCAFYARLKT